MGNADILASLETGVLFEPIPNMYTGISRYKVCILSVLIVGTCTHSLTLYYP